MTIDIINVPFHFELHMAIHLQHGFMMNDYIYIQTEIENKKIAEK